jgi:hypothetical protein
MATGALGFVDLGPALGARSLQTLHRRVVSIPEFFLELRLECLVVRVEPIAMLFITVGMACGRGCVPRIPRGS